MELNRLPMTPMQRSLSDVYGQMQATPFERGFTSSDLATQAASLETSAMEAATTGDLATRDALLGQAKGLRQRAIGWAPTVDSTADIENPIDALSFAAQGMGSATRSTAPSIMGGLAGAATGVGLPAALAARGIIGGGAAALNAARAMPATLSAVQRFAPMVGAMVPGYQAEMEEAVGGAVNDQQIMDTRTPDEILAAARGKGLINMIPEAIGPAMMVSKVAGTGLRKAVTSPKQGVGTALKGVATGFGTEAATEGVQSLVGQATQAGLRNEQFDPDWQQVADEAVIGGLFGGGMGAVGGVADATYGATRGTVDGTVDGAGRVAQDPRVQAAYDAIKGGVKAVGGKAADLTKAGIAAGKDFVEGAAPTFVEGMQNVGDDLRDGVELSRATKDPNIGATTAGDAIRNTFGTLKNSVLDGVSKAMSKDKAEVEAAVEKLDSNPYTTPGYAELGLKSDQDKNEFYSKFVKENGTAAFSLAKYMRDNMADKMPEREYGVIKNLLEANDGMKLFSDGAAQAQVATLYRSLVNRDEAARDISTLFDDFVAAQHSEGKTVPGKFSRQSTVDPAARERGDNVRQVLEGLNIDKQTIKKIVGLAEKGNKQMFDMAVTRELMSTGKLGSTNDGSAVIQADLLRDMVSQDNEFTEPPKNRKERRAAARERQAGKELSKTQSNLATLPRLIDETVSQHIAGTDIDTPTHRRMLSNALQVMTMGIIEGTASPQKIARSIALAHKYMGEKGAEMLDKVANLAEWHAQRMSNPKIADRAKALRSKIEGDKSSTPIAVLDQLIGGKGTAAERRNKAHSVMGQLISAYMDAQDGKGRSGEVKKEVKSLRSQAEKLRKDVRIADADKADFEAFEMEKTIKGANPDTDFAEEVKRITGKDIAKKVRPLIEQRIREIETALGTGVSGQLKAEGEATTAKNDNDGDFNIDDNEARQTILEGSDEQSLEMADAVANESGTQGETAEDFKYFGGPNGEPLRGEALGKMISKISRGYSGARIAIKNVREWAEEKAERENLDVDTLLDDAAKKLNDVDKKALPKLKKELEELETKIDALIARDRKPSQNDIRQRLWLKEEIGRTDRRVALYAQLRGDGGLFFNDRSLNHHKYVTTEPAQGTLSIEVDAKTLDKYTRAKVPLGNDGFKAPGVVRRSIMQLKNENGSTRLIDVALMLYHQLSDASDDTHKLSETDASGAGENSLPSGMLRDVRHAFTQIIASMMLSTDLSKDNTFFENAGDQASRKSRDEFHFNPNMVIYRNPETKQFITYGQAFDMAGDNAASAKPKSKLLPFEESDLEAILPEKRKVGKTLKGDVLDSKRIEMAKSERHFVSEDTVLEKDGKEFYFSPRALIKAMMYRHNMRADEILDHDTDGISKMLAAQLLHEGIAVLKSQGYDFNVDLTAPQLTSVPLWETYYGQETPQSTVTFMDVVSKLQAYQINKARFTGTYDYRSDRIEAANETLVELASRLNDLENKLAVAAGKPKYEQDRLASQKAELMHSINAVQMNMFEEQKLLFKRQAAGNGIEGENRPELDTEVRTEGTVDIDEARKAENRKGASLFDRSVEDMEANNNSRRIGADSYGRNDARREHAAHEKAKAEITPKTEYSKVEQDKGKPSTSQPSITKVSDTGYEVRSNMPDEAFMYSKDIQTVNPMDARRQAAARDAREVLDRMDREEQSERIKSMGEMARLRETEMKADQQKAAASAPAPSTQEIIGNMVDMTKAEGLAYARQLLKGALPQKREFAAALAGMFGSSDNWPQAAKFLHGHLPDGPNDGGGRGKFSREAAGNAPGTDGRARVDHERRLGEAVDLLFDKTLPRDVSGQHVSAKDRTDIKNATKALNRVNPGVFSLRGTTAHENWHAVKEMLIALGPEGQAIVDTIERAAHRPEILSWIANQLMARGDNEAAIQQLSDAEEASAFFFQFFVENEGRMPVPVAARGLLQKVVAFMKKIVGIRDDIIKSGDFFKYFDSGEFLKNHTNPQAVLNGMLKNNSEKIAYHLNKAVKPIREMAFAAFGHAIDRIHAMKIPEYNDVIDRYQKGWDGYAGYAEEQRARFFEFSNEYAEIVNGYDINKLPEAQQEKLEKLVQRFEQYKKDAGPGSGFAKRKNIPPSLDTEKISRNLNGFKHDLMTFGGVKMTEAQAESAANQIMIDGYWRQNGNNVELFRNHPEVVDKWKSDDKNQHAFVYFKQGSRSAEMARINNPPASTGLKSMEEIMRAGDEKATAHQRKLMQTMLAAYEGRTSYDMNPTLRKLFGASISFMNMSLLPFAVFSQMLEPLQLAFRKNSINGAMRNTWRGMTDLPRSFTGVDDRVSKDKWEKIAGRLGVVPIHAAVGLMADLMSDIPMTGKLHKANQIFFRYNGMEQWSRSMHVAATQNAFEFIKHHDKHPTDLGRRLLGELGLKPGQVRYAPDGEIDFDEPGMRRAVLQFVNESMAHPDPGTNTMWMNDPYFALVAHLKRFTFGFSYYIHGRAMSEIKNDNWKALLPLAYAVPWMIAVDGIKDFIKPGDEAYKNNWEMTDYLAHGVDRSGLLGRYGLGADIGKNIGFGGSGVESLAPTAEAISKVMRGVADGNTLEAVGNILPGHQLVQ